MKPVATDQKLRGGYYTPQPIARFLADWAVRCASDRILEPSCGDGAILLEVLRAAIEYAHAEGKHPDRVRVQGVEIVSDEAGKAIRRVRDRGLPTESVCVEVDDFFSFFKRQFLQGQRYDAIVGNPPFIRFGHFQEEHRERAIAIMEWAGLRPNRLMNAWVAFVVASTLLLDRHGRLAMVIPAELLQVTYAAELRQFLSDSYSKITLLTFRKLVFEGIQQEVVLLLAERNGDARTGIRTIELDGTQDLAAYEHTDFFEAELKPLDHSNEKWTRYFLSAGELDLLRALEHHEKLTSSGKVIDVDVGIVTGLNEFFVLTQEQVRAHRLERHTQRIVGRSGHLPGLIFDTNDWQANVSRNYPAYLLALPDVAPDALPPEVLAYVRSGEAQGIHTGYKCRIRRNWYTVPSVWTPDAFLLRQIHGYPKLVVNQAQATCTDTIHRVKLRNGAQASTVAVAFLNALTFAFTEVVGRSYGGGVLELEPSEAEKLPMPFVNAERLDVAEINRLLLDRRIEAILDLTGRVLLIEGLGLDEHEVVMLHTIWEKLRDRRIQRK